MNLIKRDSYWFRMSVAVSLLLAALFGCPLYESVCAAAWRLRNTDGFVGRWASITVWLMDLLEKDHCLNGYVIHQKLMGRYND